MSLDTSLDGGWAGSDPRQYTRYWPRKRAAPSSVQGHPGQRPHFETASKDQTAPARFVQGPWTHVRALLTGSHIPHVASLADQRSWDGGDDDPVSLAAHARHFGFEIRQRRAEIKHPPAAAPPEVISRAAAAADRTAVQIDGVTAAVGTNLCVQQPGLERRRAARGPDSD